MRVLFVIAFSLLGFLNSHTGTAAPAPTNPNADRDGQELAKQLREMAPTTNLSVNVMLKISPKGKPRTEIPMKFETKVIGEQWVSSYTVTPTNGSAGERVEILRSPNQPNIYKVGGKELRGSGAMIPLAGSDFWLADLGLEFLHWPEQRLLKREMRHSQSCFVLESANKAATSGYSRVISWVDIDTGGIVHADAYDSKGKQVKDFRPSQFQKINGRWEIRELLMENEQTDSKSVLQFDFVIPDESDADTPKQGC